MSDYLNDMNFEGTCLSEYLNITDSLNASSNLNLDNLDINHKYNIIIGNQSAEKSSIIEDISRVEIQKKQ